MATNKHALIRYQALDKCFRNFSKRFYIIDLVEACSDALAQYDYNSNGIQTRQVYEDIRFMESEQGWEIPLEKHKDGKKTFYRYSDPHFSINKQPLSENEKHRLKETLITFSRFKGMPQFEWIEEMIIRLENELGLKTTIEKVIEFEQNQYLKGIEHIETIYNAIISKNVLSIEYKSYRQEKPSTIIFHAYYLKQYNNRWFILGLNNDLEKIQNLALDRIEKIEEANTCYIENNETDFSEFFEDVIGVTVFDNQPCEKIILKIDKERYPYIDSKPLHGSQKRIESNDNYVIIELQLKRNYELDALLLSHGEQIEILAPADYREHFKQRIQKLLKRYE